MKTRPYQSLKVKLDNLTIAPFMSMLQTGFFVEVREGASIKSVLCDQYEIEPQYFEDRIQTIFLDGKPVDEAEKTRVASGSTLALSTAMPGLVGSTFRRGGVLAAFRNSITHREDAKTVHSEGTVRVKIKLFNLLVRELGPGFLERGIFLHQKDIIELIKEWTENAVSSIQYCELNGKEIPHEQLGAINWPASPDEIRLIVED